MSVFGWCNDSKHQACRGQLESLVDGSLRECSCECHTDEPAPPRKRGW